MTWFEPTDDDWKHFAEYKAWWAEALKQLLGWSESRIQQWIDHKHELYTTLSDIRWCLHYPPGDEITPLLYPRELRYRLRDEGPETPPQFDERLLNAIEGGLFLEAYIPPYPDWEACRKRVNEVLSKYGCKLPNGEDGEAR